MRNEDDAVSRLSIAVSLREQGLLERSCAEMKSLVRDYPDNAEMNFQAAWSHDNAGLESEAIPFYEQALKVPGLNPGQRQEALLGLGSSYRLMGRTDEAVRVLEDAVAEFPENAALQVFKAIACHEAGRHDEASGILLNLLAETSSSESIIDYRRPIREYAQQFLSR